ncbi:ATP-binding protein [Streptomyces sp. NPDC086010]|uniref:ATP-binding protein n=1 Tax=Streptomyces sp. NPDC086010 TaxID=3365745 RepID=UPI0037D8ADB2
MKQPATGGGDLLSSPAISAISLTAGAAYDMSPVEIGSARSFVRDFLLTAGSEHGVSVPSRVMDVARLVVSELATNVCKYAPGPCLLDVEVIDDMLAITMWDSGDILPMAHQADPARAGQHGLEIVLAVCQSFEIRREPVGKRIRVQISLLDGRPEDRAGQSPW